MKALFRLTKSSFRTLQGSNNEDLPRGGLFFAYNFCLRQFAVAFASQLRPEVVVVFLYTHYQAPNLFGVNCKKLRRGDAAVPLPLLQE
jgi:hypothetical protein